MAFIPNLFEASTFSRYMEFARESRIIQSSKQIREMDLLRISGERLPDDILAKRISSMFNRMGQITSKIPVPVTLHLQDSNKREWELYANIKNRETGELKFLRDPEGDREEFEFSINYVGKSKKINAFHTERGMLRILGSKNSEREIKPGEKIFEELIGPVEKEMEKFENFSFFDSRLI